MIYEYKSVVFEVNVKGFFTSSVDNGSVIEMEQNLNDLGRDGWELAGVFPFTDGGSPAQISRAVHQFKRPVGDK